MARVRGRLLAAAAALYVVWCGVQTWLGYRGVRELDAFERTQVAHLRALEAHRAAAGLPVMSTPIHPAVTFPASIWIRAGAVSAVAMMLVLALGASLVLGGRRWWSLSVALIPAAVVVGKFQDGYSVGQAWTFTQSHLEGRLAAGSILDALTIAAIVSLFVRALPHEPASVTAPTALMRAALPAIILLGWWLIQNPVDADGSRKVWIAQAIVWVITLALLASSSLPLVPKVVALLIVAPYLSVTMLDDLIGVPGTTVDTTQFVHHMLFAAGVTIYVTAVPAIVKLAHKHRSPSKNGAFAQV